MEYLSPQGVLLPLVYGATASPLWFELPSHSAWQATPSWTVYQLACHRLPPLLRVTFAMVPDAAWPGSDQWPWSTAPAPGPVGWRVAPVCPTHGVLVLSCPSAALRVRGVLGHMAPVHRCPRSVWCVACAASWAPWLPFTGVPAECVVLRVRCPGPLSSCSPVRLFRVLLCVRVVLGHMAPVPRFVCSVFCYVCAVSWATWLLFTGVPARFVLLCRRCPWLLGSCSQVCPLSVWCCVYGVPGLLAPVHWCACSVFCFVCAVS